MRERLAFLHIPKSAGTSLRVALFDYFPIEVHSPWRLDPILYGPHPLPVAASDRLARDDRHDDRHDVRFMAGHLSLPTIERRFDAADVVCILREPRSRVLSQYTFWRTYGLAELEYWLPYTGNYFSRLPLSEFLAHPALSHFVDNLMTRMLVGPHPHIPVDAPIRDEHDDVLVELGCAAIERMGFVDVLERGTAVFDAFDSWFGSPLRRERVNETVADAGIPVNTDDLTSATALDLLAERSRIDRHIWLRAAQRAGVDEERAVGLADATLAAGLDRTVHRARDAWDRIDRAAGLI